MEKFNVKKIENAILTDCPDDAIQEVIETGSRRFRRPSKLLC